MEEILKYGGELIDPELAKTWVYDIIDVVRDLRDWGAEFITDDEGDLDLKMFPSHTYPRALHHHDTTGNMVTKVLSKRLRGDARIGQHPHVAIVDLIMEEGRVIGAWGVDYSRGCLMVYAAREVILATGGGSGLFYVNDNPPQVTGDGYVLGFRAGAPLLGIEMIDFQAMCCAPEELFGFAPHPTGFINAGAIFLNQEGEAFLKRYFPDTAEKSTRSEVILAMAKEIHAGRAGLTGGIYMDATRVPMETIQRQIPHVYKTCLSRGIDITKTPLEVAPGSHTWLGGLEIDADGKTRVPGLWAAGETGGGIHGGNRIGGSALSASLVYGRRAGGAVSTQVKESNGACTRLLFSGAFPKPNAPGWRRSSTAKKAPSRRTCACAAGCSRTRNWVRYATPRAADMRRMNSNASRTRKCPTCASMRARAHLRKQRARNSRARSRSGIWRFWGNCSPPPP